jgi:hypothetical protein
MTDTSPPVVDVTAGVMATVLPPIVPPVFLRLAPPADGVTDRARQAYLERADAQLRTCTAGWRDGPGVLVAGPASAALAAEVHELGRGLRALAEPALAADYLDLVTSPAATDGRGANPQEGE